MSGVEPQVISPEPLSAEEHSAVVGKPRARRESPAPEKKTYTNAVLSPKDLPWFSSTGISPYGWFSPGWSILVSVSVLAAVGIVFVFSASVGVAEDRFGNGLHFLLRQAGFLSGGIIACLLARKLDYRFYARHRYAILGAAVFLLALVLVPSLGMKINGARRWFHFGPVSFQPSEAVKVFMVLYMADLLARKKDAIRSFRRGFIPPVIVMGTVFLLIAMEPDLGTALLLTSTLFVLMFVAGIRWKHVFLVVGTLAPAVAYLVLFKSTYILARVQAFLNPNLGDTGVNYQQNMALMAMGRGGMSGVGLGHGLFKYHFLPEAHNDFIFAVLGEELGLAGTLGVILLFLLFLTGIWRLFLRARDRFTAFTTLGLGFYLVAQAVINIAVVTKSMPNKGIALPFISYGGSGLVCSMFAAGILLQTAERLAAATPPPVAGAVSVGNSRKKRPKISERENEELQPGAPGL